MLPWIGHWIRSLVVIVLLGNLAEFLLPRGDLKRYAGLVIGLVLLAAMISPLTTIWHGLQVPSVTWATTVSSGAWQTSVNQEELSQARSMILSLPGVTACHIDSLAKGPIVVTVMATSQQTSSTLIHFVRDAVRVTTASQRPVQVVIRRPVIVRHQPARP